MKEKVSQFMEKALFDEANGYYKRKNPLGKNGDFITAPEISQVFGEMVALYILQASLSFEGEISLVEMGAGRGVLFYDILTSINKLAKNKNPQALDFLRRAKFHIIEINEVLIKIQQEKLAEFSISWHKSFAEFLPQVGKIFFIANELFDCFAIDQYVKTDIGWCERVVISANLSPPVIPAQAGIQPILSRAGLDSRMRECLSGDDREREGRFVLSDFNPEVHNFVESLIGAQKSQEASYGAVFEHSASARNFMTKLCQALQNHSGIALIIDYGYCQTEFANTLQALKNHQKTNVLEDVGQSDITAHVDFSLLEKIAKDCKLATSLISQAEFLLALGIEERRKILLKNKNLDEQNQINSAIERLIGKDQMGELFKCLIVWKS